MSCNIVVGIQCGDEGKGKLVDYLTKTHDAVVRFQGGNNAGHTVIVDGKTYKFNLIPSGAVSGKVCFLSSAVVINPEILLKEMKEFPGIENKLFIDEDCHIIMPYHEEIDALRERTAKIGTTKRGIGPTYEDRASRVGLVFRDLLNTAEEITNKVKNLVESKNKFIKYILDSNTQFDAEELVQKVLGYKEAFKNNIVNVSQILNEEYLNKEKKILLEGAQGTFLDISHGGYPNVTSSHTLASYGPVSCGFAPKHVEKVIGVVKAYTTRVGRGDLRTELPEEQGNYLRKIGAEFGVVTGRPRRCGWLDLEQIRRAIELNGITELCLTKSDILVNMSEIKVALPGKELNYANFQPWSMDNIKNVSGSFADFINLIQTSLNIKVTFIGYGADRDSILAL